MEHPQEKPFIHPLIAIPFGILAVSTSSIFIRYIQAENVSSLVIAALRLSLAAIILAPYAVTKHRRDFSSLSRKDISLAALSGIFLAIHFATWITSLEFTTVASSVVFVSTSPLWVALFAPVTIKEPITRVVLIGMGVALIGGVIIGLSDSCDLQLPVLRSPSPDVNPILGQKILDCPPYEEFIEGDAFIGDALALAGALSSAGYILIGRRLREKISLIPYIFMVYGIAAVVLLGFMIASSESPFGHSPKTYFWIALLAIVPQLLGHSTFNWVLRYLSAAYVSITLLGEPIGSAILAFFFLNEVPSGLMIFGAILILFGIFITSSRE